LRYGAFVSRYRTSVPESEARRLQYVSVGVGYGNGVTRYGDAGSRYGSSGSEYERGGLRHGSAGTSYDDEGSEHGLLWRHMKAGESR